MQDWGQLSNSRGATGPLYLWLGDANSPAKAIRIDIAQNSPLHNIEMDDLAMDPNDQLWCAQWHYYEETVSNTDVFELDPAKHAGSIGRFSVRLPMEAHVYDAVFSPGADRIAWRLGYVPPPPFPAFIQRWLPLPRPLRLEAVGVWVSRNDGTDMHEIGHYSREPSEKDRIAYHDLRWLPDGKTISFIHDDTLYSVSTE